MFLLMHADTSVDDVVMLSAFSDRDAAIDAMRRHFITCLSSRNAVPGQNGVPGFPMSGPTEWTFQRHIGKQHFHAWFSEPKGRCVIEGVNSWAPGHGVSDAKLVTSVKETSLLGTDVPNYDRILNLTLIRRRDYENETWADAYVVPLTTDEANALNTPSSVFQTHTAKTLILEKLHKFMASEKGWKEVCNASQDFNWGDAVQYVLDQALHTVTGQYTAHCTIPVVLTVDQDEHIAPANVPVVFTGFVGNDQVFSCQTILDMTNGNLSLRQPIPHEHTVSGVKPFTRAAVIMPNNDTLECDPDEDFMRLKSL